MTGCVVLEDETDGRSLAYVLYTHVTWAVVIVVRYIGHCCILLPWPSTLDGACGLHPRRGSIPLRCEMLPSCRVIYFVYWVFGFPVRWAILHMGSMPERELVQGFQAGYVAVALFVVLVHSLPLRMLAM